MRKTRKVRKAPRRPRLKAVPLASRSEDARLCTVNACLDEVRVMCREEGYDSVLVVAFKQDNNCYSWTRQAAGPAARLTTLLGVLDVVHADLLEGRHGE